MSGDKSDKNIEEDLEFVDSISEIQENITNFNDCIKGSEYSKDFQSLLAFFRRWYYSKSLQQFGPSKFIGYKNMDCSTYLEYNNTNMDGRETERVLREKFDFSESVEGPNSKLENFLNKYDKEPSKKTTITEIE